VRKCQEISKSGKKTQIWIDGLGLTLMIMGEGRRALLYFSSTPSSFAVSSRPSLMSGSICVKEFAVRLRKKLLREAHRSASQKWKVRTKRLLQKCIDVCGGEAAPGILKMCGQHTSEPTTFNFHWGSSRRTCRLAAHSSTRRYLSMLNCGLWRCARTTSTRTRRGRGRSRTASRATRCSARLSPSSRSTTRHRSSWISSPSSSAA